MLILGKVFGAALGYLAGGVLGTAAGIALGHGGDIAWKRWRDGNRLSLERVGGQSTWFESLFVVMGHVAKADGQVSRREIQVADALIAELGLNRQQRDSAIALFRQGKQGEFHFSRLITRLNAVLPERHSHERFLKYQLLVALADGSIDGEQLAILRRLRKKFGIDNVRFRQLGNEAMLEIGPLLARHASEAGKASQSTAPAQSALDRELASAYALLKISREAEDEDVVRAYRRQLSKQHPDKLAARGATEEEIEEATVRTRSIRHAYERIRESRGIA